MNKLIQDCVKYLQITRPYRVILQSKLKNPNWFAYHTAILNDNDKILQHRIHITMQEIETYHLNTVVAHEFVHAWQMENGKRKELHGKHFQRKALELQGYLKLCGYDIGAIYRKGIDA
jgi:hypothetical protein